MEALENHQGMEGAFCGLRVSPGGGATLKAQGARSEEHVGNPLPVGFIKVRVTWSASYPESKVSSFPSNPHHVDRLSDL